MTAPERDEDVARPPATALVPLRIDMDTSFEHITLIAVAGTLDGGAQDALTTAARWALKRAQVLILDLRGLTACDAGGVRAVLAMAEVAGDGDALLVLRPAPERVQRMFRASAEASAALRFTAEPAPLS